MVNSKAQQTVDYTIAYFSSDRTYGRIVTVTNTADGIVIDKLACTAASNTPKDEKPLLIGLTKAQQAVTLDPVSKQINILDAFPEDAFPAHIYSEPNSNRAWFMYDGDSETGNDRLNCGENGSSVTIVENVNSSDARFIKTICVGRGHHQAHFTYASANHPNVPLLALISNLTDGTISVIDNEPSSAKYLQVIKTINLCEPEKEDDPKTTVPNNAFPHGLVYSAHSGKIYNLNNGYGSVAVIDPVTLEIEARINFKGHSNLFVPADGRYVLGRGADRKSNPQHVIAKLSVLDVTTNEIVNTMNIDDVYISKYFFNPEATRLYLTTSSSGNDAQKENLKADALLVFDISHLPEIRLINETRTGFSAGTLDFVQVDDETQLVFCSIAAEGKILMLDNDGNIEESIKVDEPNAHSRLWCI